MKTIAGLLWGTFLVLILQGWPSPLSAQEGKPAPLKLNELIEEALNKNPDVQAAKSKWEVFKERPPQAGALDSLPAGPARRADRYADRVGS